MKKVQVEILNWIAGESKDVDNSDRFTKFNPHNGEPLSLVASSSRQDVNDAVGVAQNAWLSWSSVTAVNRGKLLSEVVSLMKKRVEELAKCISLETAKPPQDALGEVEAAILQGEYWASEGMRLYGQSLQSAVSEKYSHTVRCSIGVAGLIVPANTPIANIAWKVFPALICGNTVVLKASEDAPNIAFLMAQVFSEAGLPDGVFNVIQGLGAVAGESLVADSRVGVISFTGSTFVGKKIAAVCGERLARVSLELGGKNPFVVCDDANLEQAVYWASLSAFSNAGQRCAAASRFFVFDDVYEDFRDLFVNKAKTLKLGVDRDCDLGPVITKRQHEYICEVIQGAIRDGGRVLCGGGAPEDLNLRLGYYVEPTIIENIEITSEIASLELFGPVATIHRIKNIYEALEYANSVEYGLTSAIHTSNVDRAMWFAQKVQAGVANVNLGTFGSEPHMPFGGFGASGNGTREPGEEAINVYTELKNISFLTRSELI